MINESTKINLRRKSNYIDSVQVIDGIPLFSWIDINLTELCNRKCVFCPRIDDSFYPNQNLHMGLGLAEKLAEELRALKYEGAIVLCGFGEPMLHPELIEIIRILSPVSRVELVTNGDKLGSGNAMSLVEAGLDYFVVSMYDGPHQIEHFQSIFAKAEIDESKFILRDRWHSEEDSFGLKLTNRGGTIHIGQQEEVDVTRPCYYPAYSVALDWNGDVLLCVQDWNKKVKPGNLYAQSLFDIWQSNTLKKYRHRLISGRRSLHPCIGCNADGTLHGFNHADLWKSVEPPAREKSNG